MHQRVGVGRGRMVGSWGADCITSHPENGETNPMVCQSNQEAAVNADQAVKRQTDTVQAEPVATGHQEGVPQSRRVVDPM